MKFDFLIIGGGIIGLATAWQLQQRFPGRSILVLEKEDRFAAHQTGRNSGVIHAGVYYPPGSLKARFCKQGVTATTGFCREHGIPYEQCGKLLVAGNETERVRMQALWQRCAENEIEAELLDQDRLRECEPNIAGVGAILVKATGIVDYGRIARHMAVLVMGQGGQCRLGEEVTAIVENDAGLTVTTDRGSYQGGYLVSCAGLMADRLARLHGLPTDFSIIPFRGEYYQLPAARGVLINHLIYPIPDPELPFLGVHLTRMIDGRITVGPNAVLGWKREGYGALNFCWRDAADMLRFGGFWKLAAANLGSGLNELKNSWWKPGYLKRVQKYCPALTLEDLLPYPAGVRAQAVMNDGTLVHDFLFAESPRALHVCNAPSPAATSAIPIAGYLCDKITTKFNV
jgi:L-2-hydroxyglutarate oxidase